MEALTTIEKMFIGNQIIIPSYQRAYSWDTPRENCENKTQTDVFLSDLLSFTNAGSPYYFGHFLFEENDDSQFAVIDGQQRLTTIVIFLSALFSRLKKLRELTEDEEVKFENIIKRKSKYIFATVDYDNRLFKDYVIDQTKNEKSCETTSQKRIIEAFDYFYNSLKEKEVEELGGMIHTVTNATCTTHTVTEPIAAIQMFIFQNNRGKKPSNLEIIKAQFMFHIHLYEEEKDEKDNFIQEIKERFEQIYKSISSIECKINEDDVLLYTLRVHFNSLWESNALDKIDNELSNDNSIAFIKDFTKSLSDSFEYLTRFLVKDQREYIEIHSLVSLGGFTIAIPFIIKAYKLGLEINDICKICSSMEKLVLRNRLIGTRANLISRINDVYQKFSIENKGIEPLLDRIEILKESTDWWWAYWNKSHLSEAIQGGLNHSIAKFLLWKYEIHLESDGKRGYASTRFDNIDSPELEHIAPQTPTNGEPISSGYCEYNEEFKNQYIDCLGNYLLISKSHNCSVGNKDFSSKRVSYKYLAQQREIQDMTQTEVKWDIEKIKSRKEKIVNFILNNL